MLENLVDSMRDGEQAHGSQALQSPVLALGFISVFQVHLSQGGDPGREVADPCFC